MAAPRITLAKAVYDFHHRHQELEESVDDFLTALQTFIMDCDLEARSDREL